MCVCVRAFACVCSWRCLPAVGTQQLTHVHMFLWTCVCEQDCAACLLVFFSASLFCYAGCFSTVPKCVINAFVCVCVREPGITLQLSNENSVCPVTNLHDAAPHYNLQAATDGGITISCYLSCSWRVRTHTHTHAQVCLRCCERANRMWLGV